MIRRAVVIHERHEPTEKGVVAAFVVRHLCGGRTVREVARVEVHGDGTVVSRRADGTLERQAFGATEQQRADALLWLSARLDGDR